MNAESGPLYHGTVADLRPGDLLSAGVPVELPARCGHEHVCFTALRDGAGLAAELAAALAPGGRVPRVYRVDPLGAFEDDPNVTDKMFPGSPTRSYRSTEPLRVIDECTDWTRLTPDALKQWCDRLTTLPPEQRSEIIN